MVKLFTLRRADRQLALLLFAGIFALYMRTLAPGLLFGDSGEFQVAAWTLGLAHPTGYPLYLLLGSLWQHLLALLGISPAYALNVFSALFGALTVVTLYLALLHWLPSHRFIRRVTALLGALFLAFNPTFWSQSLTAEVYTLHAFLLILILHTCYRLMETVPNEQSAQDERLLVGLALLCGISLTHHALTLLLLPTVGIALWWSRRHWTWGSGLILRLLVAFLAPLLLYLYIPLRRGPGPSPWYHQAVGNETLTLLQNNWSGFWQFITGQSISVGFHDFGGALAQLPQAWILWRLHFFLPGLVMIVLGIYVLIRARNWRVLALLVPFFLVQQFFNLIYAIGDILVYYIPLYLVAAILTAFTADTIGGGLASLEQKAENAQPADDKRPVLAISMVLVLVLLWMPIQVARAYLPQINQAAETTARELWDAIVAAQPPADTILVSNDRNEIVPLFYLQAVEGKVNGITGLFPLIEPGPRFADIGATLDTALAMGGNRPLYLIKAMPGLEVKYDLQPATPPLVLIKSRGNPQPTRIVDQGYGPLHLLGYDLETGEEGVTITLYWEVRKALMQDYTTTVQLFDGAGEKLGQSDAPPGGIYYPTSLWKVGEVLVERHLLAIESSTQLAQLLVAMYDGHTMTQLASPLEIGLAEGR